MVVSLVLGALAAPPWAASFSTRVLHSTVRCVPRSSQCRDLPNLARMAFVTYLAFFIGASPTMDFFASQRCTLLGPTHTWAESKDPAVLHCRNHVLVAHAGCFQSTLVPANLEVPDGICVQFEQERMPPMCFGFGEGGRGGLLPRLLLHQNPLHL